MTDDEKIEIYNQCMNKTYYNIKLEPILKDIYELFEYNNHKSWFFNGEDILKIDFINELFPQLLMIVDSNNVDLFHKLIFEIIHPNKVKIDYNIIFEIMNLLLSPIEYCNSDKKTSLPIIIDYFVDEDKTDFYKNNSNYLFFLYLTEYIEIMKINHLKDNAFGTIIIYYFLKYNVDYDKFIPAINYAINNETMLNTFIKHNYVKDKNNELLNILMNIIINEINHNKIK